MSDRPGSNHNTSNMRRKRPTQNTSAKSPRKRRNTFAIFYVITMIIGVVVCVTLFALAYQTLVPDRIIMGAAPNRPDPEPVAFERVESEVVLGMIASVGGLPRSLTLHFLDSGRSGIFNMTDTTTVQDRRGNPIGFGELNLGEIVEVTFDTNTQDMTSINLSGRSWQQQHRGNFDINLEAATITIGNQVYYYSSRTMVLNNGEPFPISMINPEDSITLVGFDDKIWSIWIDGGHGFIRFLNAERVISGTVSIGNIVFTSLEDSQPVAVIEGTHRVIVNGQNIETFIADVVVRQGRTSDVDLMADMTLRQATLQVIVNAADATVFIDGEPMEGTIIDLDFGTYLIRAEAPGYIPVQQEIELDQPILRIDLEMTRDATAAQILIETFPSDAQIFLDDAFVGNSPVAVDVDFGNRTIVARRAGYEDRPLHVLVDENSPRQYLLHMLQLPANVPPLPDSDTLPGSGNHLPPPPPGVTPIPAPTIPSEWPTTWPAQPQLPQQPPPQPVSPQQPQMPPSPPSPDEFLPDWPVTDMAPNLPVYGMPSTEFPSVDDLPVPEAYSMPYAPGYMN